jgi:hypothetical protein
LANEQKGIAGFNPQDFAKNLAGQAGQVIPADISAADKKFIIDIVYKFCVLSGDALTKDTALNLDAAQASLITQFIGEWSFHKSIDLLRAKVNPALREGILQRVAFTVFEIAKQAVVKKMPQEQIIPLVEHHVNTCFKQAIEDLKSKGQLDEKVSDNVLHQSNIDSMAKTEVEKETVGADMSDAKILKLASLALLIKNFPAEKIKNIISKFNKPEAQVLIQYLKMPDLENKVDSDITARCITEIRKTLPEPKIVTYDRCFRKLCKIVKNSDKNSISNIIKEERPVIRDFVLSAYTKDEAVIPARVAAIICKHLEEKLTV